MAALSVRLGQLIVAGAVARGVAVPSLLAAAELLPSQLADADGWLTQPGIERLWLEAVRLSGDSDFGLHLGEQIQVGSLGGIDFAVRSSANLGEAYTRVARFLRLMHQELALKLDEEGGEICLRPVPLVGELPPLRQPTEFMLSALLRVGRLGTGQLLWPQAVRFRHPAPPSVVEHQRLFGSRVSFGAPRDELVLDRRLLALPQLTAEPALCVVLDQHLQELVGRLPGGSSFRSRLRDALLKELAHGEPRVDAMAERLHLSPRSLQRRLQSDGTTLQEELAKLRADLAVRYLSDGQESIAEVAFLLGYSEVSTFYRAFKRHTGLTPAAYRSHHRRK